RRGHPARRGMEARGGAARSDVRRRNVPLGGGRDHAGARRGPQPRLRVREARALQRGDLGSPARERDEIRARRRAAADLRSRPRQADTPQALAQDRALQRRARVPAVRVPHGGGRQPQAVTAETWLRLALVPAAVWLASLAARRWGHSVSGYLGGMPLIGGP